jgi:hypothetical protein
VVNISVGTLAQFVGGAIGRAVGTALAVGVFFVVVGVTPWEFVAHVIMKPPKWMTTTWFRLGILVVGLVIIFGSLRSN